MSLLNNELRSLIQSGNLSRVFTQVYNEKTSSDVTAVSIKEAAFLAAKNFYIKRAEQERISKGLEALRLLSNGDNFKFAESPWGTIVRRSVAPAILGGATAAAVSPDDPEIRKRNAMIGAGIGAGGGMLGTLYKGIQTNPQAAQQLFSTL